METLNMHESAGLVELNDQELIDTNGGNPIAIAALAVAVFKLGYDIGKDMAKNGW